MASAAIALIRLYRLLLSPLLPFNHCRYYPSCSEYAMEAITKFGAAKGGWLAAKRIARCHPYSKRDAFDPIP
jgi:putative membrane protein insertion efficiency factor